MQAGVKGMTLELALEACSKLQLVAEDVMIKNIQLQECIAVLGREVAGLKSGQQQDSADSKPA